MATINSNKNINGLNIFHQELLYPAGTKNYIKPENYVANLFKQSNFECHSNYFDNKLFWVNGKPYVSSKYS